MFEYLVLDFKYINVGLFYEECSRLSAKQTRGESLEMRRLK